MRMRKADRLAHGREMPRLPIQGGENDTPRIKKRDENVYDLHGTVSFGRAESEVLLGPSPHGEGGLK